jgi:hypothetical protein
MRLPSKVNLVHRFIAHLSIPCVDAFMGKLCINKAIEVLFSSQASNGSEGHLETTSEDDEDAKPVLVWNSVYVQDITQVYFFDNHYGLCSQFNICKNINVLF